MVGSCTGTSDTNSPLSECFCHSFPGILFLELMSFVIVILNLFFLPVFDLPAYCLAPHDPQYGRVTGDDYWEGATIHYHCNPGYYMTGEATATCLSGNSRMWTSPTPKCIGKYIVCSARQWFNLKLIVTFYVVLFHS